MDHRPVNEELTLFSYEILGLVGRGGAGAHDLLRMAQRGRILAWAGESQYYVEPKRLAELGYLEARKEFGPLRDDLADLLDRLDESDASAETLPHRRKYLLLANGFLRRLLDLHLDLIDEVERELAPKRRAKSRER